VRVNENHILLLLTLIIGAIVGLVVVAFIFLTENLGTRLYPPGGAAWRRLVIPLVGALSTGFLLARYFPNARGSGIPQTKAALFIRDGFISFRTVLGKFGLSSMSLASGIALGREGPSVQVGAGIASVLGRRMGLSPSSIKALVPVGASAALAAAFNTPIAAVLFSLEEVMGDMHAPVLGSIVLSSATSWIVLHLLLGDEPLFHVPAYQLVHPVEFLWYGALGIFGGLVSVAFVKLLLWQRKRFLSFPKSSLWIHPAFGGLLVGILGWFVPPVLGVGYNYVGQALNGQMVISLMALLVCLKVVATATCYGSGNAGGIFGPSLYIGAMMGGTVGGVAHMLMPDYTGSVGAYALVGMGAAFAGIVRVPLTSVIMIFEMTRDYSIIVPLMISNLISYFISSRLQEDPIYEALQHQDGIHLPSGARARSSLLMVGNAFQLASLVLSGTQTIAQAAASVDRDRGAWPVMDAGGLRAMVTAKQLDDALAAHRGEEPLASLVPEPPPVEQLTMENFPHLHPDHTLDDAVGRLAQQDLKVLPVVSRANVRELKGTVTLEDVLTAYRIGRRTEEAAGARPATTRRITPLAAAVAGLVVLFLLAGFLNYFYRARRAARAEQYYQAGNALVKAQRYEEAVEQFRNALSISHSLTDRLALGMALAEANHPAEAAVYLGEVVNEQPDNAPAHLALAHIDAQEGKIDEAVAQYRGAMEGAWPQNPQQNRIEAHIELVNALSKAGRKRRAQSELLGLAAEVPPQPALQRRVAKMLADSGLPNQAAALYREIFRNNPQDADALDGFADAEMALGDFSAAENAFADASRIDPTDSAAARKRDVCSRILALDPSVAGLKAAERYQRSRSLLMTVLELAQHCTPPQRGTLAEAQTALTRRRPVSFSDAADENIALAEVLWSEELGGCPGNPPDEALARLMPQLNAGRR
jgi:CIC family chloride channel protein